MLFVLLGSFFNTFGADKINYGDTVRLVFPVVKEAALHSHNINYRHETSSKQQQVTGDRRNNADDLWIIRGPYDTAENYKMGQQVQNGDVVRFEHQPTRERFLHNHLDVAGKIMAPGPVVEVPGAARTLAPGFIDEFTGEIVRDLGVGKTPGLLEISVYQDTHGGNEGDNWKIVTVDGKPLTTDSDFSIKPAAALNDYDIIILSTTFNVRQWPEIDRQKIVGLSKQPTGMFKAEVGFKAPVQVEVPEVEVAEIVSDGFFWGVNTAREIFFRTGITHDNPKGQGWFKTDGRSSHIEVSADGTEVWCIGMEAKPKIHRRDDVSSENPTGTKWVRVDSDVDWNKNVGGSVIPKQLVIAGNDIFFVSDKGDVYQRMGITAENPKGKSWDRVEALSNIKAAKIAWLSMSSEENKRIFAITDNGKAFHRTGVTPKNPFGTDWELVKSDQVLTRVAVSPDGKLVFALGGKATGGNAIFHLQDGKKWQMFDGGLLNITVWPFADDKYVLWGVNNQDNIFFRENVTANNQSGTQPWSGVDGKLIQISGGGLFSEFVVSKEEPEISIEQEPIVTTTEPEKPEKEDIKKIAKKPVKKRAKKGAKKKAGKKAALKRAVRLGKKVPQPGIVSTETEEKIIPVSEGQLVKVEAPTTTVVTTGQMTENVEKAFTDLGLEPTAKKKEVEKQFKILVKEYHPDKYDVNKIYSFEKRTLSKDEVTAREKMILDARDVLKKYFEEKKQQKKRPIQQEIETTTSMKVIEGSEEETQK